MTLSLLVTLLMLLLFGPVLLLLLLPMMTTMVVLARWLLCWVVLVAAIAVPQLLIPACLPERPQHVCTCLQHMTAA
jgi:hypothetical protein